MECFFCKKNFKEKELEITFVEVPGPHEGCAEFAPPEQHPVKICTECNQCEECEGLGCYQCALDPYSFI